MVRTTRVHCTSYSFENKLHIGLPFYATLVYHVSLLFQLKTVTKTCSTKRSRSSCDDDEAITNAPKRSKTDKVAVIKRFAYIVTCNMYMCLIGCVEDQRD